MGWRARLGEAVRAACASARGKPYDAAVTARMSGARCRIDSVLCMFMDISRDV
jgi:hypothetical protein